MNVVVCTLAYGGWYPKGVARMIQKFSENSPGVVIRAAVNVLPFGSPANVIENGYDYTAYCAKPFMLMEARLTGADLAILLDAAFYPIRDIGPLIDHVAQRGYYFCKNGQRVGQWASDRCLERMGIMRPYAMEMEEISSYCVGLNFADGRCVELLARWCGFAGDRLTVPGHHTNMHYAEPQLDPGERRNPGRNAGFVSKDPRVKGHRHDQTVLSIKAHQMGMTELCERPLYTTYLGHETAATVLVNQGMGS
jgi:hypothetical protein